MVSLGTTGSVINEENGVLVDNGLLISDKPLANSASPQGTISFSKQLYFLDRILAMLVIFTS